MQDNERQLGLQSGGTSWEESVSTWVDGEASIRADELDSPYGRQLWDTYHLIGDVLRSKELALEPSERFYARVSKAIDEEPTVVAPRRVRARAFQRRWPSLAVAAAVVLAVAGWFTLNVFEESEIIDTPLLVQAGDELPWNDYIDAHMSLAGTSPARYVSYADSN